MNRKDSLMLAVMVNVLLVAILFFTARKPTAVKNNKDLLVQVEKVIEVEPVQVVHNERAPSEVVPLDFSSLPNIELVVLEDAKETSNADYIEIIVKRGDFLEKIAKVNGVSVSSIMKLNDMYNSQLKEGQVIKIPTGEQDKIVPKQEVEPCKERSYYVIKDGDSLWKIANQNNLKIDDLLKMNDLDQNSARRIKPGDRLRIS